MRPLILIQAGLAMGAFALAAGAAPAPSPDTIDQAVLDLLTPGQAAAFVNGADPETLVLEDGRPLARHLEELLGGGGASLVFSPVDSCSLLRTTHSVAGKMAANEIRPFLARGETVDLSGQGGSAAGCGIPTAAVALVLSVTVEDPEGSGRLKGWPVDAPQPQGDLLVYQTTVDALDFFSLAVVGLCDLAGSCVAGDFNLRNTSAAVHVRAEVAGYLLPVESCPAGSSIASIGAVGAVVCEPDDDTLAALTCAVDEVAKWNGAAWACAPDEVGSVTDVWVDETGDTMTGQLVVDTGGGTAIESHGDIDLIGHDLRKSGDLLLHTPTGSVGVGLRALQTGQGTDNTAVGEDALADNTGVSNTAVGRNALRSNTIGVENTALGEGALTNNTEGIRNTAVGAHALRDSTTGNANTAVGMDTMYSNTIGRNNTAVGEQALFYNTSGESNVAIGQGALRYNTIGAFNVGLGQSALHFNDYGNRNVALGDNALSYNISGSRNVAVGQYALQDNTTGLDNVAAGYQALSSNTTGSQSIALGVSALQDNMTSDGNIALGQGALRIHTFGDDNIAMGRSALANNVSGSANVAIGHLAGIQMTGSTNVAIGNSAGSAVAGGYDNIMISNTGAASDGGVIRIGTEGTHGGGTFIAGIYPAPLAGSPVVVDINGQLGVASGASGDADTLDGLDSGQFLRSDGNDSFTDGQITFDPGTTLRVEGGLDVTTAMNASTASIVLPTGGSAISGGGPGTGLDADLLDGLDSGDFIAAGTDLWVDEAGDTMTGPLALPEDGLTVGTNQVVVSGGQLGVNSAAPQKDLHVTGPTGAVFHNSSVVSPSTSPFFAVETDLYSTTGGIVSILDRRQQTIASRTPVLYLENSSASTDATNPLIEAKAAGATRLLVRHDGRVGIGTASPETTLEVTSVIRATPTDAPGSCSAATEGGLYYDDSMNEPCFCNGSDWQQFDGGGVCT